MFLRLKGRTSAFEAFRLIKLDDGRSHASLTASEPPMTTTPCGLPVPPPSEQIVSYVARITPPGATDDAYRGSSKADDSDSEELDLCETCEQGVLAFLGGRSN